LRQTKYGQPSRTRSFSRAGDHARQEGDWHRKTEQVQLRDQLESATNSRVSSWNDLKSLLGHLSRIELFKVQSQFKRNSRQNFIFKFGLQSSKDYLFFHQSLFAYQEYYLHINSHTWKYVRLLWTPCPFSDCTQRS
jgi:catechol-2,3-dioxygenase